ncbi:MAG: IS1595 family transposase [Coprobacillus sp.]
MEDKMFNDILDSIISNATPDEIEIIREKLNNHLVNYIYDQDISEELSNEFDSSFCYHCHSHHIIKYGKDKKGNQRFYCKDCQKTFSVITESLLSYTKKEPYQWYLYIDFLFHGDTIVQSAEITGICEYTSLVWRHKILSICAELTDEDPMLSDIVYLDEKLVDVKHPGIVTHSTETIKTKRGISNQKRNIVCALDIHNHKVIQVSETGRIHSDKLIKIYKSKIPSNCKVVSDSLRSYHKLMKELNVEWIKIPSGKREKDGYTLDKVNQLHSSIELFLHSYRGVSDKYLRNYIGLYKIKDRYKKYYKKQVFKILFKRIINSLCILKYKDFRSDFSFSMI